jgi:hypothetical protein
MLPKVPFALEKIGEALPKAKPKPYKTREQKIAEIKKKFNLHHGKGKRKKKRRKK